MAVGITVLAANLVITLYYYHPPHYYISLQEAWNTAISHSLVNGALIVAIGSF